MTCTATGLVTAIGPYRNVGTVTAEWSSNGRTGTVTDTDPSNYLGISPITIEKLTNGEEADTPPGPSIVIGDPVIWEYRLTNIGVVPLTGIVVDDDRGVVVSCAGQTTLAPGATMTCTGAGFYVMINVGIAAEPAHLAHGDGKPGEAVPGQPGRVFTAGCNVQ
jgi:hypothetical protein